MNKKKLVAAMLVGVILGSGAIQVAYAFVSPFLSLDNSLNQYIEISDVDQMGLDITGDMTIECWVSSKGIPSGKTHFVVAKDNSQPERSFAVGVNNQSGTYSAAMLNSSDGTNATTPGLILSPLPGFGINQWHHVAWVFDASKGKYKSYLDGVLTGTVGGLNTSTYNSNASFSIGGSSDAALSGSTWDGYLDSCRVWDKKRTAAQISNKMSSLVVPDADGLVGQWTFRRNFSDTSEYANHMHAVNGATLQN